MGQYKFSVYFKWQIGLLLVINNEAVTIHLPFIEANMGLTKGAYGIHFFGIDFQQP
jgi:hypothetical protein